jgi:hypothetical protein
VANYYGIGQVHSPVLPATSPGTRSSIRMIEDADSLSIDLTKIDTST